jgi:hypothetical protein
MTDPRPVGLQETAVTRMLRSRAGYIIECDRKMVSVTRVAHARMSMNREPALVGSSALERQPAMLLFEC